jgi:hypothetical protein
MRRVEKLPCHMVLALLFVATSAAADKRCQACALVMQRLPDVHNAAQVALEPARAARDRAAKASEKVQTRKWLKGEDGVALHSAAEDGLEGVCGRMELRSLILVCLKTTKQRKPFHLFL